MATCKDCVHFDVCCSYLSTAYNKCKLATPDFKLLKNIECDECQHFKDRGGSERLCNISERGVEVMTEKLKPCPFCGSKSVSKKTGVVTGLSMFLCYSCGATVSFQSKEHDPQATQAWNRRVDNAS